MSEEIKRGDEEVFFGFVRCPRRYDSKSGNDYWRADRTCSHCGSLHPDDFIAAIKQGYEVGPTDKDYKAYINLPSNSHAKFYYPHLSPLQEEEFVRLYNEKKMKVAYPGHFYVLPYFAKPKPLSKIMMLTFTK